MNEQVSSTTGAPAKADEGTYGAVASIVDRSSRILDGRVVAAEVYARIREDVATLGIPLTLCVIQVGDNKSSNVYIRQKEKFAKQIGIGFDHQKLSEDITEAELIECIHASNQDPKITGFIIQMPLPKHIREDVIISAIDPTKDVDGFTPQSLGNLFLGRDQYTSCTPKGVMHLLAAYGIDVKGKHVAIIGRSNIVGKPLATLLINASATVTSCNSSTQDISVFTRTADIVICATGRPGLITPDHVRPGTVIIDVGFTVVDGVARGDADYEALLAHDCRITPVPGGVGAMTVVMLMENVYLAGRSQKQ